VSFVYIQSATPFGKKGRAELTLPRMDVPVSLVEWEMFLPDRYRVRRFDGDALPVPDVPVIGVSTGPVATPVDTVIPAGSVASGAAGGIMAGGPSQRNSGIEQREAVIAQPGQVMGRVVDASDRPLAGATVRLLRQGVAINEAVSDAAGWFLMSNAPAGRVTIIASLQGFLESTAELNLDAANARRVDFTLPSGAVRESVAVYAEEEPKSALKAARADQPTAQAPSQNVFNLQRRVAGVLPVRIDVPRAGAA